MGKGLIDEDEHFDYLFDYGYNSKEIDEFIENGYDINKVREDLKTTKLNYFIANLLNAKKPAEKAYLKTQIKKMIDLGADVESMDSEDLSPLSICVMNDDLETLIYLMDYATDLSKEYGGVSLFDIAIYNKHEDIIEYLLELAWNISTNNDAPLETILGAQLSISLERIVDFLEKLRSDLIAEMAELEE